MDLCDRFDAVCYNGGMKIENLERAKDVIKKMNSIADSRKMLPDANCNRGLRIGFSEIGTGNIAYAYVDGYDKCEAILHYVQKILEGQYSLLEQELEQL